MRSPLLTALCFALLTAPPRAAEDREWALRRALQQINAEIEKASRNGVAIWFPMGDTNLRVVRLSPRESRLLNSRCAGVQALLARFAGSRTWQAERLGRRAGQPAGDATRQECLTRVRMRVHVCLLPMQREGALHAVRGGAG